MGLMTIEQILGARGESVPRADIPGMDGRQMSGPEVRWADGPEGEWTGGLMASGPEVGGVGDE